MTTKKKDLAGIPDELSTLLGEQHQSNREDIWLWLHLAINTNALMDPSTCNGRTMRKEIARALKRRIFFIKQRDLKRDQLLVPDNKLRWIENDERQNQWLLRRVRLITELRLPRGLVHLTDRDRLIAMIDLWDTDIENKDKKVEYLRQEWLEHKSKDSEFNWFNDKKDGEKRCNCAWEWLKKHYINIKPGILPIGNYKELLMFFDREELGPNEKKAIIQQIKKKWSRKQFDERTADKKQVNIMLSKTVIAQLDELAKQWNLKRAQVLETLISQESKHGMYTEDVIKKTRYTD